LLYKFGRNLNLKTNANSVITVNSVHRLSYTAGDLLLGSRRARGRVRLRAGMVKLLRVVFVSLVAL
jgi:hypothetical protein